MPSYQYLLTHAHTSKITQRKTSCQHAITHASHAYVDEAVISEFVNACGRGAHKSWQLNTHVHNIHEKRSANERERNVFIQLLFRAPLSTAKAIEHAPKSFFHSHSFGFWRVCVFCIDGTFLYHTVCTMVRARFSPGALRGVTMLKS